MGFADFNSIEIQELPPIEPPTPPPSITQIFDNLFCGLPKGVLPDDGIVKPIDPPGEIPWWMWLLLIASLIWWAVIPKPRPPKRGDCNTTDLPSEFSQFKASDSDPEKTVEWDYLCNLFAWTETSPVQPFIWYGFLQAEGVSLKLTPHWNPNFLGRFRLLRREITIVQPNKAQGYKRADALAVGVEEIRHAGQMFDLFTEEDPPLKPCDSDDFTLEYVETDAKTKKHQWAISNGISLGQYNWNWTPVDEASLRTQIEREKNKRGSRWYQHAILNGGRKGCPKKAKS